MAHIHSVLTDVPSYTLTQMEFYEFVAPNIKPRLQNIFKRILSGSQIRKRHFSTSIQHMIEMTTEKKIEDKFKIWKDVTMEFWENQAKQLLDEAGLAPEEIDGICTSTTSGFITPDPTVLIPHELGMRADIVRIPLFGYGCSGGLAAIHRVSEYLEAFPKKAFLVFVGETLSTQYEKADSVSVLVSNSIFADGFAGMLMVGKEHRLAESSQLELLNTKSLVFPNCDFAIGQWMTDEGLHTHIDAKLPKLIKESVKAPLDRMFGELDYEAKDVDYWICHAGGPKVMEAFGDSMKLDKAHLETTMETYRDFGNQSSVSIITALEKTLKENKKPGLGYMMAIGPGIHMEYSLCKVTPKPAIKSNRKTIRKQKGIRNPMGSISTLISETV